MLSLVASSLALQLSLPPLQLSLFPLCFLDAVSATAAAIVDLAFVVVIVVVVVAVVAVVGLGAAVRHAIISRAPF